MPKRVRDVRSAGAILGVGATPSCPTRYGSDVRARVYYRYYFGAPGVVDYA